MKIPNLESYNNIPKSDEDPSQVFFYYNKKKDLEMSQYKLGNLVFI